MPYLLTHVSRAITGVVVRVLVAEDVCVVVGVVDVVGVAVAEVVVVSDVVGVVLGVDVGDNVGDVVVVGVLVPVDVSVSVAELVRVVDVGVVVPVVVGVVAWQLEKPPLRNALVISDIVDAAAPQPSMSMRRPPKKHAIPSPSSTLEDGCGPRYSSIAALSTATAAAHVVPGSAMTCWPLYSVHLRVPV